MRLIPLNGDFPKPGNFQQVIFYGEYATNKERKYIYVIGHFDHANGLHVNGHVVDNGLFTAMQWAPLPEPAPFDLQEPPPIKKFEVGKYYMHSGGGSMFVCGFCQTETWGTCLVAEELGGGLRPVAADDPVATQGWREVSVEEFHHPGFRVRDFPPTMGTKTE